MSANLREKSAPLPRNDDSAVLRLVQEALDRLRFGSIQLTIHEGKLVQIDVTEKTRLPA